ncbi:MAG: AAA family ATPase [Desulfobacteraceae bacterium]|nr:AAA family ATPase [Desulfobacteraceae bacterium]
MYTKFFGLKKRPFILTPDPNFLYFSSALDMALTHLEYGLIHNAGFIALTGEIGVGKTTLLKYLFDRVSKSQDIAMIFNTQLDSLSLLEMIAREFELPLSPTTGKAEILGLLHTHFIRQYSGGKRSLIVIDEAQNLSLEACEELRMLSNLEADNDFLVQIILVGQHQLRDRLSDPNLAQLTQRISVYYHLPPLEAEEVSKYVEHRLKVAGYDRPEPLFTPDGLKVIAEISKGVPRVINTICESALTYAFADDLKQIGKDIIEKVVADHPLLSVEFNRGPAGRGADDGHLHRAESQGMSQDLQLWFSSVDSRLQELEKRMARTEQSGESKEIELLRAKLEQEKERSENLSRKLAAMSQRNRELETEFENLRALLDKITRIEPASHRRIRGTDE